MGGERTASTSPLLHERSGLITYLGLSMYPTLRTLDLLCYRPYDAGHRIRIGDVVLFRAPGHDRIVIHRVVAVTSAGIRTQGDNNLSSDPDLLTDNAVLGRVLSARRGRKNRTVSGGTAGRCRGAVLRLRRRGVHLLGVALHRPYEAIARRCPVQIPFLRIVVFRRTSGTELHLLLAGRSIGRLPARERAWRIRQPFGLFVNEETLPRSISDRDEEI